MLDLNSCPNVRQWRICHASLSIQSVRYLILLVFATVQVFHFVTLSLFTTFILWHAKSGFALRWGQGGGRVMMRGEGSRLIIGETGG